MMNLLFLLLLFSSLTLYSQNMDIRLLRSINVNHDVHLDGTFKTITNTAGPVSIATPIIVIGAGLIEKDKSIQEKRIMIGTSYLVAAVISTGMKYSFRRTRPFVTYPEIQKESTGGSSSFPSGHTSDAFATATSLSLAFPKWYVIAPSFAYASAVGYSRMFLGVHYPSDVLAGAAIGAGSAYLSYKVQKWVNHKKHNRIQN